MRILKWVLIALAVLIVAAVVVVLTIDVNRFKPQIEAAVENATGRNIEIAGDLGLKIFPSPAVAVNGVTFANAEWGSRPAMATVGEFAAEVDLLALIGGQIKVDRLVLADVDLLLEKNQQGRANWEFTEQSQAAQQPQQPAPTSESGSSSLPVISEVLLRNVKLAYRDSQGGTTADIALNELSVEEASGNRLATQLVAVVNGNEIAVNGTLGGIAELTAPTRPWPIDLVVTLPGARASIVGTIAQPMQAKGLALKLGAEVPDLAKLAATFGAEAPALPVKLQTDVKDAGTNRYALNGLTATIAQSDIAGSGEIALDGARPAVKFDLASRSFDVATLLNAQVKERDQASASSGGKAKGQAGDGRMFSDEPLPLDGLTAIDADISYKAERFIAPMLDAQNLTLDLNLNNGVLNVKPFGLAMAEGGNITGDMALDGKAKSLSIKLDAAGLNLSEYLQKNQVADVVRRGAPTDMAVDLRSQGGSVRQIMAGLNGTVILKVGEGELKEEYVRQFMPDLARAVGILDRATAKTKLFCVVSGFEVKNGVATPRALLAETGSLTLAGDGNVNLGTERLDLTLATSSRDTALAGALPPVRVRGTFADPSFSPDTQALVKGALGAAAGAAALGPLGVLAPLLGSGGGSSGNPDEAARTACSRAVALAEGREVPPAQQQPQSQQQQQPSGNQLEDLRKGLGGLLRR